MAAPVVQSSPNTDTANAEANVESVTTDSEESESKSELKMDEIADMLSKLKLNPLAKEFFPSSYNDRNRDQLAHDNSSPDNNHLGDYGFPNNRRRRNNYNHGRKRVNGRAFRAQREDNIRRTVYVSEIDHNVTEEQLAALFSSRCGQVVDCRICGDPNSGLRFAFVEFADEGSAKEALNFSGTVLGFYPIRVLPSKTAILPVNPTFLPRSEDEREMCARTVYCTNIDREISHAAVKFFFESCCGEVSRLRILGDQVHTTRIAFVEFALAESAIAALNYSGTILGTQPIRVSPSKTPVRSRVSQPALP
ncbi:polyadenylate-binding protein-interacting protein 9-like [Actinidia eriantha]|uniref:polyadenylate-binding protein-interacting protein 9-like n=1 Tax=Actinidia eriantha TaxID=165200 RepID=UPI002589244E|nr:polyadenylate-binding protein-interacting protein 9-like [Actinidia eriantha]